MLEHFWVGNAVPIHVGANFEQDILLEQAVMG